MPVQCRHVQVIPGQMEEIRVEAGWDPILKLRKQGVVLGKNACCLDMHGKYTYIVYIPRCELHIYVYIYILVPNFPFLIPNFLHPSYYDYHYFYYCDHWLLLFSSHDYSCYYCSNDEDKSKYYSIAWLLLHEVGLTCLLLSPTWEGGPIGILPPVTVTTRVTFFSLGILGSL